MAEGVGGGDNQIEAGSEETESHQNPSLPLPTARERKKKVKKNNFTVIFSMILIDLAYIPDLGTAK